MSHSDDSPQRDDRNHRRSCSRSPISPEWAGETPAKREERRLAETAVPVGPPTGQLQRQRDAWRVIQEGGAARRQGSVPATRARSGGQEATGEVPRGTRRGRAGAHTARSEGANADGALRPAAAGGDRARAADIATQGREPGRGQGTKRARRGASRAPRRAPTGRMERSEGRWASAGPANGMGTGTGRARAPAVQARAWVRGGETHGTRDRSVEAGKGTRGRGKGAVAPQGQAGRGMGARGGGRNRGRGPGGEAPPQPDVQPVRCIPPGIQQMPAHHTHTHHHHHAHLYIIAPDAGKLIPPQPPRPQHPPAPRAPRAEPARMASAGGGTGRGAGAAGTGAAGGAGARGKGGPGPGTGTGARSRTLWGMRPSPWWWRCTGG